MTNTSSEHGHCLCKQVKVKATSMSHSIGTCHCGMCRRWGGGPMMTVDCGTDVVFEGADNISVYDSSEWAQRGFCSQCGTHLFYKLKANSLYIMPVGIFESDVAFEFDHQVFIDAKPTYYAFSNKTHNMTGKELFEKYAPE